jgi:hypothetical protein
MPAGPDMEIRRWECKWRVGEEDRVGEAERCLASAAGTTTNDSASASAIFKGHASFLSMLVNVYRAFAARLQSSHLDITLNRQINPVRFFLAAKILINFLAE